MVCVVAVLNPGMSSALNWWSIRLSLLDFAELHLVSSSDAKSGNARRGYPRPTLTVSGDVGPIAQARRRDKTTRLELLLKRLDFFHFPCIPFALVYNSTANAAVLGEVKDPRGLPSPLDERSATMEAVPFSLLSSSTTLLIVFVFKLPQDYMK